MRNLSFKLSKHVVEHMCNPSLIISYMQAAPNLIIGVSLVFHKRPIVSPLYGILYEVGTTMAFSF